MGQQQSVPENGRAYEHCLPRSTLESNSKYSVPGQSASKRRNGKHNSAYSLIEQKSFNSPIPKPLPDLNKDLPKIQCQNQKRSSNFRSRMRSLKAQVSTEETDNLRNITHLFSRSDLSCNSESDQKQFDNDVHTNPSKDYRKCNLWSPKAPSTIENEFFHHNGKQKISVDEKPSELASLRHESHIMGKKMKTDSQFRNSTELYRNSFLRHSNKTKIVPKSRAEDQKSSSMSCRQHLSNPLNNAEEDKNGIYQKTNDYQYNIKDSFQPQRTVTPDVLDYRHIGAFKLGTLRITNGVASPAPSIEQGIKNEKRPQSRDTSIIMDSSQYNRPLPIQGPRVKPWTVGWGSPLRNNEGYDQVTHEKFSINIDFDTEDTNFNRLNIPEERIIPLKSDLEHAQNFEDAFTHSMISPYSLVELVEPSTPPQKSKIELAVRDCLFDEEPWTPTVLYHPSPNLHNRTPQILGEGRVLETPIKPLAKADSGYRSNTSVKSKKANSEHSPDGDKEFRASRSNSGAFSFVPSITLNEDQSNQKTDESFVDSGNVNLLNSPEDGNSLRRDYSSDMSEDENAFIHKINKTISNTQISYATLPFPIEPASIPSLSSSPTHTTQNITSNSTTDIYSPQRIPYPLLNGTGNESSESISQRYNQEYSVENLCQVEKSRGSYSLNLASKALLLQSSNSKSCSSDETIQYPPSLIENYRNLDKTAVHNSLSLLAPFEFPTEIVQGSSPSINTKVIHYEDAKATNQKKQVVSIENKVLNDSNQADTKNIVNYSRPADVKPKNRLISTPENQAEQTLEESSLKFIDLSTLLDSKEISSLILGNENIQLKKSVDKSSTFPEFIEKNESDQYSPIQNQSPSPPIPKRSDLRVLRKNSLILSEESKLQHKLVPNTEEISAVTRNRVHFSTKGLDGDKTLSTTSQHPEDSKESKFHQVAYRLGKYKQIGPRPVIVPTLVATFQAIEQTNTQKDNSSLKPTEKTSGKSNSLRNDLPVRKKKSIENTEFCLPLGLLEESDKFNVEKISGTENNEKNESTRLLRQKKSSQSISSKIHFPKITKDELESDEPLKPYNPPKDTEQNRPKRYRRSSSALTTEIPKAFSVLKTRKSFEVRALENRTGHSDTGRFHSLREGVSRFITSMPGSTTSSNDSNTKSDSANEKSEKSQKKDWRIRSSNSYSLSESKESVDMYMTRNLDQKAFSNMSHNIRSNSKKGSSNTSRKNETGIDLTRKNTLSPPRRKPRSHPPQAHVTRRSYSMFNQPPPTPNIKNCYYYIENTQKQNLERQNIKSMVQLPSFVEGKTSHHKIEASLLEKPERKFGSTGYTLSERLDNKINQDEQNPPKISGASENNFPSPLPHQNSNYSESNALSSNFINCGKSTHEECNTICKKEEQQYKHSKILADNCHNGKMSRIESKESQINKPRNDSVLNRGRPVSRAVETALLSKRSDAHIASKFNKLKNHIRQENSNYSHSITLDKDEILVEAYVPSYSDPKKESLTKTTLSNLDPSKEVPDKGRNSHNTSETNLPSTIKNSIDTLPSQKTTRNITLSSPVPSQRSTLQESHLTAGLRQNDNVDHSFLENPHPKIPSWEDYANEISLSLSSKSPISKKKKEPTTISTLPLDGLFDKAPLSINTRSSSPDATNCCTPSPIKISTEARFEKTMKKESPCENYILKEDQDAPTNTISSLDSLPSQCKDSNLRNSKNFRRLSHSLNEGTTSKDNIPEMEYSQVQVLGSRGLRKINTIESRQDQNHVQIHSNSPVRGPNTSFSKNFPTIPNSISSFHNPSLIVLTDSYPSSSRASMLNIIDPKKIIMSPYLHTSPLSSISNEEDSDIIVLSAGWRKDAVFTTHNGTNFTHLGLDFNSNVGAIGQKGSN